MNDKPSFALSAASIPKNWIPSTMKFLLASSCRYSLRYLSKKRNVSVASPATPSKAELKRRYNGALSTSTVKAEVRVSVITCLFRYLLFSSTPTLRRESGAIL